MEKSNKTFGELGLDNWLNRLSKKLNYVQPSKIQELSIP